VQLAAQTTMTLSTSPNPSTFGAPVTLMAMVSPSNATGRVTFYDGVTVLGTQPLSSGTTSLSTILLPAGVRKLKAYYSGDSTTGPATASATQTVNATAAVGFRAGAASGFATFSKTMVVGDFNRDGKADIVLGASAQSASPNFVTILLGNGDGTFQNPVSYATGANPVSAVLADFNGDGITDIAVACTDTQGNGILSLLAGNGDGTFQQPFNFPAPSGPMAAADFNSDGKTDLVIIGQTGSPAGYFSPMVFLGNGDGSFKAPLTGLALPIFPGVVVVDDFNGDGNPDIVIGGPRPPMIALGNGDGTFQNPVLLGGGQVFSAYSIAVGDFNGDGKPDLAMAYAHLSPQSPADALLVLLGNGDGSFQSPVSYDAPGNVIAADFNGDGITDLAAVASPNGSVSVLRGNGDGSFQLAVSYVTATFSVNAAVADFNGDGRADIADLGTNNTSSGNQLTILTGVPAGVSITATTGTAQSALTGTMFQIPLQVIVIRDGSPVNGAVVTFAAPSGGASAQLSSGTAVTNTAGLASVVATANNTGGSYVVTASYQGLTASFSLTNTTVASIQVTSGTPQSTPIGATFPIPIGVLVKDNAGNPASGAVVTFTVPSSGASASIPSPITTVSSGIASTTARANSIAGTYTATASVNTPSGPISVPFTLTNTTIGITTSGGTPQSALIGSPFPIPLQVTVRDSAGNPIVGTTVNFTAPSSGASATLSSTSKQTDASGVARITAVANNIAGTYMVTATVPLLSPSLTATFTLTNLPAGNAVNLALGKTATQSSTLANAGAANAVDGNTDGSFYNGSVTHTNPEPNAWWQVDLGSSGVISSIVIWNRTDCCSDRLNDYWIFISNTPFGANDTPATLQSRANTLAIHQTTTPSPSAMISVPAYQGQYVRIQLSGTNPLSLAEVQVMGTPGTAGFNLALGKPATQSSTLANAGASNAVDGNTDGSFYNGSVTHTNPELNAWWQVDLGTSATINSIVIWNRTDCCSDRLSNYYVFVSNVPFGASDSPTALIGRGNTFSSLQSGNPNSASTTISLGGYQGQFVRIQLINGQPLSLAEVQVFGTPGASSAANVALAKLASQSSTLAYPTAGAGSAVDGNTDGNFFDGSVTHTNLDTNAWWQVDLGASGPVDGVVIWNRTDCCFGRLNNAFVFVSDTPFSPTDTPTTLQGRAGTFSASIPNGITISSAVVTSGAFGRYVRVQLSGTNNLSLAEVQVIRQQPPQLSPSNLALGKPATQSSTLTGNPGAGASAAVDGNTNGSFYSGSITHTNADANAWWQVDLGTSASLSSIVIWNRTDCCSDRLGDYWVFVSDTPFASTDTPATLQNRAGTWSSHQTGAPNPSTTITLPAQVQGRYVRVQLSGTNYLSLAEVQVMGF
jgi:hypothetical protein